MPDAPNLHDSQGAGSPAPFRRGRLAAALAGGALLLIAIVITLAFVLWRSLGCRAAPETLFAGIQQAIDEGDARLCLELVSPKGADIDSLLADTQAAADFYGEDLPGYLQNYRLTYNDAILGESGDTALVIATVYVDRTEIREVSPELSSLTIIPYHARMLFMLSREKGRWYIDMVSSEPSRLSASGSI